MQNNRCESRCRAVARALWGLASICLLAACGGGSNNSDAEPAAPSPSPAPNATATLSWSGSSNASIAGYRVYHGVAPGAYQQAKGSGIAAGRVDTFVVTGLAAGQRHYFAVTAHDAQGNESDYSPEASKVVQ
jgi:hypothetical protein